jgi:hypothetical protein
MGKSSGSGQKIEPGPFSLTAPPPSLLENACGAITTGFLSKGTGGGYPPTHRKRNRGRNGSVVLELAPEDYSYEILQSTLKREEEGAWAKHSAFSAAWKFLVLILVMKALTLSGPKLKTGSAAKIYSYLRDHYKGVQDSPISILTSYA